MIITLLIIKRIGSNRLLLSMVRQCVIRQKSDLESATEHVELIFQRHSLSTEGLQYGYTCGNKSSLNGCPVIYCDNYLNCNIVMHDGICNISNENRNGCDRFF